MIKGIRMKKQINQLLPTLLVMILILALTVTTYHISFKQIILVLNKKKKVVTTD